MAGLLDPVKADAIKVLLAEPEDSNDLGPIDGADESLAGQKRRPIGVEPNETDSDPTPRNEKMRQITRRTLLADGVKKVTMLGAMR